MGSGVAAVFKLAVTAVVRIENVTVCMNRSPMGKSVEI